MRFLSRLHCLLATALLACAGPALAQTVYPTAAGASVKVQGVVPLQCNASGAACAPVTASNPAGPNQVVGSVAHDAADSGAPVKVGGYASATAPAAVTAADRVNAWYSLNGAQVGVLSDISGSLVGVGGLSGDDASQFIIGLNTASYPLAFDGTNFDRQRGDTNGLVVLPGLSSTYWSYANGATGILSNTTTAVTMKTAAGASVRNFIDSCTINTTAFGTAVPLAIRDGAGGTVLFALNVPTAGFLQPINVQFEMPLRGTANTLLEVVTTTANTSGTVWVNCQGHTGS